MKIDIDGLKSKGVDTLIFDFGGVLIRLNRLRSIQAFESLGVDVNGLLSNYRQNGVFWQLENGTISNEAFYNEIRRMSGAATLTDSQIEWAWNEFLMDIPAEKLDLLLSLRPHFRILMLSNTNAIHFPYCRERWFTYKGHTLDDFFDHCYLSYELQHSKPEEEIFYDLLKGSGVRPEQCLFLDDGEMNVATAQRLGFHANLVDPMGDLADFIHL